jgi:hypothetical protein
VGTSGGTVSSSGVTLTIPANALAVDTAISIATTTAPGGYTLASTAYQFGPSGTTFKKPVTVAIPLTSAAAGAHLFWSNAGGGYDDLGGMVNGMTLTGSVTHFSTGFAAIPAFTAMTTGAVEGAGQPAGQSEAVSLPSPTGGVYVSGTVGAQNNGFVNVILTSEPGASACSIMTTETMGFEQPQGVTQIQLIIYAAKDVTAQQYAIPGPGGSLGSLTSGYSAGVFVSQADANCNIWPAGAITAMSGTINLTQIDSSSVSGTFMATFPGPSGSQTMTGSFEGVAACNVDTAQLISNHCSPGAVSPDPGFCCWGSYR